MKYFLKEIVQNPVIGPDHKAVAFERLADNFGIIAVEESEPAAQYLEDCAKRNILGVRIITEEQYEEYKKKLPYIPSASEGQQQIQIRVVEPPNPFQRPQPPQTATEPEPVVQLSDPLKEHVQSAMAKVFAQRAAALESVQSARAEDTLSSGNKPAPAAKSLPPEVIAEKARKSIGRLRRHQANEQ